MMFVRSNIYHVLAVYPVSFQGLKEIKQGFKRTDIVNRLWPPAGQVSAQRRQVRVADLGRPEGRHGIEAVADDGRDERRRKVRALLEQGRFGTFIAG